MTKKTFFLTLLLVSLVGCSMTQSAKLKDMALINGISFYDSEYDNNNAGNGFVVNFDGKNYAITAKHVLLIAKTDEMKFVDLEGELKHWRMYARNNPAIYLTIEKLLNSDKSEKLEWESMSDDWLVFSIKENKTGFESLRFRETALIKGESLYAIGWTYQDTGGPQRIYRFKYDVTEGNLHTLVQVKGPKELAGLSGSPVVDQNGLLVGVVSSGWEDEDTKVSYLQASKASDIKRFLESY